ncbi:MAG: hypothetical protein ACKV2T_27475 [Kofleriaceae bacterium]
MTRPCAISLAIALAACPRPTSERAAPVAPVAPAAPPDAAVAPDTGPPPPLDEDLPRLALRGVALYEEVARVFVATGNNCATASAKLREMQPVYADVAAANAKVLHAGGAKSLRAALEVHAARFDAAAKSIASSATLAECSDVREFTNAFDALVGAP